MIGNHTKAVILGGGSLWIHFYGLTWESEIRWEVNGQVYARTLGRGSTVEEALSDLEGKLTPTPAVDPDLEAGG